MTLFSTESGTATAAAANRKNGQTRGQYETVFNQLVDAIAAQLTPQTNCYFKTSLAGEDSQFTRFNGAKVRQSGQVCDGQLKLTVMEANRTTSAQIPFTGSFETDWALTQQTLSQLQADLPQLPSDPYVVLPTSGAKAHSREVRSGQLLPENEVAETLMSSIQDLDFSGLYAGGMSYRAYGDSCGKRHWFETPSFTLDYSLFDRRNQAVKGIFAGDRWNEVAYQQSVNASRQQLALLTKPTKAISKGAYRTYLAPAAVADLMETLAYGGLGEADLRQGSSAFEKLEKGEVRLSEQFSLGEDFQRIGVPRFNGNGAIAPTQLPIIQQGQWVNSLVSDRSAKEYGKISNAASLGESMRAPVVASGNIREDRILTELGTGLYLSNLHYLNWSDLAAGRITGMTRYACFWVEDGEIIAPIENLRFDDSFYRFLGEGLLGLTETQQFLPNVGTYDRRSLGGMWVPGMLIDQFRYTL